MRLSLTVNGTVRQVDSEADRPLLEVLREDLALTGTKYGCGEGQCRACTVLLDGKAVPSCRLPVSAAAGKTVTTIEGLARNGKLHPVQASFAAEGAMQCGYCVPGMILTATAFLQKTPRPTETQVVEAMNGNLCRCSGYPRLIAAILHAAQGGSHA